MPRFGADERRRGVIAMSAGNHAQAVAYHARRLGIPATIVMPVTTPFVKVKATEALGATVVLYGETLTEAQARAETIAAERNLVWVHPYDDPRIIAGQGTIALEMLEDVPDLDVLIIPIGGGGLIAGNAIAARAIKPSIEIVGVECALYPSMWNAIHGGNRPCGGATLAEGIAVSKAGALTLPIVRELVSDIILVDEPLIERAVNAFLTLQKTMAEGAGAAGPRRHAGGAGALCRPQGRPDPVRRQYRSAHPRFHHGARIGARRPHRVVPPDHSRSARNFGSDREPARRTRRQYSRRRSSPAVPRRVRPRAPSSTSPWRRETALTPRKFFAR